jgi:hypothetical protein
MKTLILTLVMLTSAYGQLDYGPKATNKESVTKMHFAMRLLKGDLDKSQESFLVRAIVNRRSISEGEARQLFSTPELKGIFFGIGREDVSTFKQIYDKEQVSDKKAAWLALSKDERVDVRRINFAWGIGYLDLNEVQIDYLLRLSKALPGITKDEADVFQTEAVGLFTKDLGRLLFSSIGPYKPCEQQLQQANCPCSVGSSFNMSCDGDCSASNGTCTVTGDGCGFAWLYQCNGRCVVN